MPVAMKLYLPSSVALKVSEDGDSLVLRPLEWSALLARLGAERDLRRELASGLMAPPPVADFVGGAAQVLSGSSHNAPGVNPDALANRKSTGGIRTAAEAKAPVAKLGARGQQ